MLQELSGCCRLSQPQWVREVRAFGSSAPVRTWYPFIGFLTGLSVWVSFIGFFPKIANPVAAWLGLTSSAYALGLFLCCRFRHQVAPPQDGKNVHGHVPQDDDFEFDMDAGRMQRFALRADPSKRWSQLLPRESYGQPAGWKSTAAKVLTGGPAVLGLLATVVFCIVAGVNGEPAKAGSHWVVAVWCWMTFKWSFAFFMHLRRLHDVAPSGMTAFVAMDVSSDESDGFGDTDSANSLDSV